MPTYTFRNKETGETIDMFMSWSGRAEYLKNNPHMESCFGAPAIISGVDSSSGRNLGGFRDVLKNMKDKHPKSRGLDHLV